MRCVRCEHFSFRDRATGKGIPMQQFGHCVHHPVHTYLSAWSRCEKYLPSSDLEKRIAWENANRDA